MALRFAFRDYQEYCEMFALDFLFANFTTQRSLILQQGLWYLYQRCIYNLLYYNERLYREKYLLFFFSIFYNTYHTLLPIACKHFRDETASQYAMVYIPGKKNVS